MQEWKEFLETQDRELGPETCAKWLRSLKVVDFDACNLYLEAKDAFQISWFEEQMREKVTRSLVSHNHRKIKVHVTCPFEKKEKKEKKLPTPPPLMSFRGDPLDPSATLTNYVAESNPLPFQLLSQQVNEQKPITPTYIYGPTGTGKTHLLMSIAKDAEEKGLTPLFIDAERFTQQLVSAMRGGAMQQFRNAYRSVDLLLVDNVDLFAGRTATQEELFHTFNSHHTAGHPIYLASRLSPRALIDIEPRLVSRFEWGIALPLQPLSPQGMRELLLSRAATLHTELTPATIEFLTTHFHRSTHSLLQALQAYILRSHLSGPSRPLEQLLADLLAKEKASHLTPEKIVHSVAAHYGIRPEDILGKSQSKEAVFPRQVAMYLCRHKLALPYTKIGTIFSRNHSTVMTSIKSISSDKSLQPTLKDWLF